jgi:hypothetical protein
VAPRWSSATVNDVAAPVDGGAAEGMASIEAGPAPGSTGSGDVLTNPSGEILGLRDHTAQLPTVRTAGATGPVLSGAGRSGTPTALLDTDSESRSGAADPIGVATTTTPTDEVFLPAELVVGVATDLARYGHDRHGWLGISGETASGSASTPVAGARVITVEASGPAHGILLPEDVIVGLDQAPIRTMAELRSRLYVLAAGTVVHVTVVRDGAEKSLAVTLSPDR